jgi:hypothetical protein
MSSFIQFIFRASLFFVSLLISSFHFLPVYAAVDAGDAVKRPFPASSSVSRPAQKNTSFFFKARSQGTSPIDNPPSYVHPLSQATWLWQEPITSTAPAASTPSTSSTHPDWLDVGLEYRLRFEHRGRDLRNTQQVIDNPFLHRTRAYLGVHHILDPLRFTLEVKDSRRTNSQLTPRTDSSVRDINPLDVIQGFGELYFDEAFGQKKPLQIQAGRMAFELLDRRLIARNEWRNTTNNFEGLRAHYGQKQDAWDLDAFALHPINRNRDELDSSTGHVTLYGATMSIRHQAPGITWQPAYFLLHREPSAGLTYRHIPTAYLRAYGDIPDSRWDYDVSGAYQWGQANINTTQIGEHRAYMWMAEIGYRPKTWGTAYAPRFSVFSGYASGDKNPNDTQDNHFERLYGFARPWSANDYITPENVILLKPRFELTPSHRISIDGGVSAYWLASTTDSWTAVNLRDKTGRSGRFMGYEWDVRGKYKVSPKVDLTAGYSPFLPGQFTRNLGKSQASQFVYLELNVRLQ